MIRPTAQDALTEEELDRLLDQPDARYPSGRRNLAILLVMADAGLRVSEVTALRTGDVISEGGQLTHLLIRHGKGGKSARQPLTTRAASKLALWLQTRGQLGIGAGPIFCTVSSGLSRGGFSRPGQRLEPGRPLSTGYLRQLVKRLGRRAGIQRNISPHTLRHTAITRFLRACGNLELTRKFARHEHVQTTSRIYAHLVQADVDAAVRLMPGHGPIPAPHAETTTNLERRVAELEHQIAKLKRILERR